VKDQNNEYSGEVEEPEHPFSVLVVDDEPYIRAGLKQLLAIQGYQVAMAGSGEEAMTQLTQNRYDLLVLDLGMPGAGEPPSWILSPSAVWIWRPSLSAAPPQ
jgi:PleD family two-component response regulator